MMRPDFMDILILDGERHSYRFNYSERFQLFCQAHVISMESYGPLNNYCTSAILNHSANVCNKYKQTRKKTAAGQVIVFEPIAARE